MRTAPTRLIRCARHRVEAFSSAREFLALAADGVPRLHQPFDDELFIKTVHAALHVTP